MLHEGGEGVGVGLGVLLAERREDFDAAAVFADRARKACLVRFDPLRGVARHAVFPTAEPEEHEPQVVLSGTGDDAVDQREVELAFARLDRGPNTRAPAPC